MLSDLVTCLTDATEPGCLYLAFFESPGDIPGDQEIKPEMASHCLYKTSLLYVSGKPSSATDPPQTLVKYEKDGVHEGSEHVLSIVQYDPQRDSLRALVDLGLKDKLKDQTELEEILQSVPVKPRQGENTSVCWLWDAMNVSPFLLLHVLLKEGTILVLTESSWYQCLSEQKLIDEMRNGPCHGPKVIFSSGKSLANTPKSLELSSDGMRKILTIGADNRKFKVMSVPEL